MSPLPRPPAKAPPKEEEEEAEVEEEEENSAEEGAVAEEGEEEDSEEEIAISIVNPLTPRLQSNPPKNATAPVAAIGELIRLDESAALSTLCGCILWFVLVSRVSIHFYLTPFLSPLFFARMPSKMQLPPLRVRRFSLFSPLRFVIAHFFSSFLIFLFSFPHYFVFLLPLR